MGAVYVRKRIRGGCGDLHGPCRSEARPACAAKMLSVPLSLDGRGAKQAEAKAE